jgi:hypothetical protein
VSEEINDDRRRSLAKAAATVAAAQLGLARASAAAGKGGGDLASLETATAWLNTNSRECLQVPGIRLVIMAPLDQESPGSSPGGAMPTVNNRGRFSWGSAPGSSSGGATSARKAADVCPAFLFAGG